MEKKNFLCISSALSLCAIIAVGFVLHEKNGSSFLFSKGVDFYNSPYVLSFDENKNVLSSSSDSSSGYQAIYTEHNNYLSFSYSNITHNDESWQTIGQNGYIKNEYRISGMLSMTVEFYDDTSVAKVDYGWSSYFGYRFLDKNAFEMIDSSQGLTQTINFKNEMPSYFMISCDSEHTCSLKSVEIHYSCVETSRPSYYSTSYGVRYYNSRYNSITDKEEKYDEIAVYTYYYGDLVVDKPADPTSSGRTFVCWYHNGEPFDFENTLVTENIELIAHYETRFNYVDYSLNEDGETYTATISANYQANIITSDEDYLITNFNWDQAYFKENIKGISRTLVTKVVLSTNCHTITNLSYFKYTTEVVFTESVKELGSRCLFDLYKMSRIIIEGDLPATNSESFRINGNSIVRWGPRVFVNQEVYDTFTHKYYRGLRLNVIGDTIVTETNMSIAEFARKSREQSVVIADYLLSKCDNEFERKMMSFPYILSYYLQPAVFQDWLTIKNFVLELVESCNTEVEKAQMIFNWISNNMIYDESFSGYSIIEAFNEKKGVCAQYAWLLHDMLCAIDVPCMYVRGVRTLKKATTIEDAINYERRGLAEGTHAWVLAYIGGEWRYYDAMGNLSSGMTLEYLGDITDFTPSGIDYHISCLPEEIAIENVDSIVENGDPTPLFKEGAVRGKQGMMKSSTISNGSYYTTGACFYYNYADYNYKFLNNYSYEIGEMITNAIYYLNKNLDCTNNLIIDQYYLTSTGITIRIDSAIKYILDIESLSFVRNMLDGTGLYIDDNLNLYYLSNQGLVFFSTASSSSDIVVPSSYNNMDVYAIYRDSFSYNSYVTNLIVEEGVEVLFSSCFEYSSIENIYLPLSINKFMGSTFAYWNGNVYLRGSLEDIVNYEVCRYNSNCTIYENYDW